MKKLIFVFERISIVADVEKQVCYIHVNGQLWPSWAGTRDELETLLKQVHQ